jgi:hypothetical protein
LVPQQTVQLAAATRDAAGAVLTGRAVAWASGTPATASVSGSGLVTAVTPGTAAITATSEGRNGTATITVADGGFVVPTATAFTAGGGRVAVDAPAGAVSAGTAVTVAPLASPPADPDLIPGNAWTLGPASTTFAQPVTVRLTWLPNTLPTGTIAEQVRVHRWDGASWVPLANGAVNVATRTAVGTTTALGPFGLLGPTTPPQTTFTVTTAANAGAGSLRQAILDANANPGADLIHFNIAGAGIHTIQPTAALPTITDPVTIDGYTQPGATPNSNPTGALNAVLRVELAGTLLSGGANGLRITGGNTAVRGLAINRFDGDGIRLEGGGGNVIEGSFLGTDVTGALARGNSGSGLRAIGSPNNRIGGTTAAARNLFSGNDFHGVHLDGPGSTGNRVEGNLLGPNASATAGFGGFFGVFITDASNNVIGGTAPGAGNVISGNGNTGITIRGASGNRIEGNLIGTTPTGMAQLSNGSNGVKIEDGAGGNTVGGTTAAARNIISGNGGDGIEVEDAAPDNRILGNYIGTDATGTAGLGNSDDGILVENTPGTIIGGTATGAGNVISTNGDDGVDMFGATATIVHGNFIGTDPGGTIDLGNGDAGMNLFNSTNNEIGGTQAGAGNVIAFNRNVVFTDRAGIRLAGTSTGNAVLRNAIYSNVGLGIDLGPNGVTPNDPGDADTGPNNLQNFPVLTAATRTATLAVTGTLNSTAATAFRVEFFANDALDPSGHGEGQRYLGFVSVTTDGSGNAAIAAALPVTGVSVGNFITATATDAAGNTSEFSMGRVVQ